MDIAFINQSSLIDDGEVSSIAEACAVQLKDHVAGAWNIQNPLAVTTSLGADSFPFYFVDDIPEAPGALAYHDVDKNGVPYGKIGVGTTLNANESVSSAASHEAVELQCDIYCASWSFSGRLHSLVATEACDPVQSDTYKIPVSGASVLVSNFVTPYYFTDIPGDQSLDYLGTLKESFGMSSGGYQIRMTAGKVTNSWGADVPPAVRAGKEKSHGRTFWRHVEIALALSS